MTASFFRLVVLLPNCVRFYHPKDSWAEAAHRLWVALCACTRLVTVYATHGPDAALSWVDRAKRVAYREEGGYYHVIRRDESVVPAKTRQAILQMFAATPDGQRIHPFNTNQGQSICYTQHWPEALKVELEALYAHVLDEINAALPLLKLQPIKESFSERMYAISYPGPEMSLPFHYDCNDGNDYKCQILLGKSDGAPSLSFHGMGSSKGSVLPFDEHVNNICVFHPNTTYHGIRAGLGDRHVLLFTFTQLVGDRRPIVCHADLIS